MKEPFTFYRAVDPVKGSWDGYGFFPLQQSDFFVFVADAPSGASIHTPEIIKEFWTEYCKNQHAYAQDPARIELADGMNRLQDLLQKRSRQESALYQSTLTVAKKIGDKLLYACVGDSILEIYRNKKLYRLAESEIWDGALIIDGTRNLRERRKTEGIQFIGNGGTYFKVSQIGSLDLHKGDLLILHTDGVEDLLPPDRLVALLNGDTENIRKEFEQIFSQEKIKDDITFLSVSVEVPEVFNPRREISGLTSRIEQLQNEQSQFRNDLTRLAVPQARLEKMERGIQQLSQQVQTLSKKVDALKSPAATGKVSIAPKETLRNRWLLLVLTFLLGLVTGLAILQFLQNKETPLNQISEKAADPSRRTTGVIPPEILSPDDCTYVVQRGDSLEKIATKKQTTVDQLLLWNPSHKKEDPLQVGQKLNVCGDGL